MKNLALTNDIVAGNVYLVEMQDGEINSFRVLSETPTYYLLSLSKNGSFEVFEKAKAEIHGIYEVEDSGELN